MQMDIISQQRVLLDPKYSFYSYRKYDSRVAHSNKNIIELGMEWLSVFIRIIIYLHHGDIKLLMLFCFFDFDRLGGVMLFVMRSKKSANIPMYLYLLFYKWYENLVRASVFIRTTCIYLLKNSEVKSNFKLSFSSRTLVLKLIGNPPTQSNTDMSMPIC